MDCEVEIIKAKMSSLLSSFRRERSKIKTTTRTGKGKEDVYVSKWFAFSSFAFLKNKNEIIETMNTETDPTVGNDIEAVSNSESEVDASKGTESINNEKADLEEELPQNENTKETPPRKRKLFLSPKKQPLKKKAQQEDPRISAAYDILKSVSNTPKDECFTFGQHIATKLQKFDDRLRSILMHRINNDIFDAEMGKHDDQNNSYGQTRIQSRMSSVYPSSASPNAQEPPPSPYLYTSSPMVHSLCHLFSTT